MTAGMGWALLNGLAGGYVQQKVEETLATFSVAPPPPPPEQKPAPRPKVSKRAEGKAAPPNLRSKATPVTAPTPVLVVPKPPPPVVVSVKPFAGNQATQGAAERTGPGTGAGGVGDGTGSGGAGNGDGDGGSPPRWRKGRIGNSDFPRGVGETAATGFEGTVEVKFLVWTDGRVRECDVTRSSGYRALDDTTCRLIQQRFRYDPSLDGAGRPVPAWIVEDHTWVVERDPRGDGG